jgi:RNA polymerase sigma-70 factor (ECF subfamily)
MESLQDNEAVNSFINEDIQLALSKIDSMYRIPFMMYFEGFKYHEIAEELDLPIGTVKNRIFMARRDLKNHLHMYA